MSEENKAKEKAPESARPRNLREEAMEAYGIKPDHILAEKAYKDHVVFVTKGGAKVSFAPGDVVKPLSQVRLDGVPPPKSQE